MRILLFTTLVVFGERFIEHSLGGIRYWELADGIQKSSVDQREYAGIRLSNRLRLLLISDPNSDQSSASLSVKTGYQDDPDDTPGLAQLCERVIQLGSDLYPEASAYHQYVDVNGGRRASTTYFDQTIFSFEMGHWALDKALGIFSQMFIKPQFNESTIFKEAVAIGQNFQASKNNYMSRFNQATQAALNCSYKYATFSIGNYTTLITQPLKRGLDIRNMAFSHYHRHYSSNIMQLVVIGRESLRELKNMVIPRFSKIKNGNANPPILGSPYNQSNLGVKVNIERGGPDKLVIRFILDPVPYESFQLQIQYVAYFLNSDQSGSLNDLLEKRHSSDLSFTRITENLEGFLSLDIVVRTTKQSRENRFKILHLVFSYLDAIKTQAINPERYQEFLSSIKAKSSSTLRATDLVTRLHQGSKFSSVLGFVGQAPEFDQASYLETINRFNTSNFILYDVGSFDGPFQLDSVLGVKYSITPLNKTFLLSLSTARESIKLPEIQKHPLPKPENDSNKISLISTNANGNFWLILNNSTENSLFIKLEIKFNQTSLNMDILVGVLRSNINSIGQKLALGSFYCAIKPRGNSVVLDLEANRTIIEIVPALVNWIKNIHLAPKSIEAARDSAIDYQSSTPFTLATSNLRNILNPYKKDDTTNTRLDASSYKDVSSISMIADGDISPDSLLDTKKKIDELISKEASSMAYKSQQNPKLVLKGNHVFVKQTSPFNTSTILYYLNLFDSDNIKDYALTYTIVNLMKSQFKDQLKNTEQIGNLVMAFNYDHLSGGGVGLVITSDHPTRYLETRIEKFLGDFVARFTKMEDSHLNSTLQSISMTLKPPKASGYLPLAEYYWSMIKYGDFELKRDTNARKIIASLAKNDLTDFMESKLLKNSTKRQKISVYIRPKSLLSSPYDEEEKEENLGTKILQVPSWYVGAFDYN